MNTDLLEKVKTYTHDKFANELAEGFSYHNYEHTLKVVDGLKKIMTKAELDEEQKEILLLAAYFHDLGFTINPDNHENYSKELAEKFLKENNYPASLVEEVLKCIEATKMTWEGEDRLCCILRDADLSGLADENYDQISEKLRKELEYRNVIKLNKDEWVKKNIEFINEHNYLSDEAKELFNEGKERNLKKLKNLEKRKKKLKVSPTIANSKSAQTQFKTALRNHIDLSSIADNKANIMLSVNAVIITVGLPLLIDKSNAIPQLVIPTIILAMVCLSSMIFATLSTRPIKMSGQFDLDHVKEKKTNVFFFGNYYKMDFTDYSNAVKEVVADNDILDNSIMRDLYFLGRSLGKKYDYLRWCYTIFMYGLILTVLASVICFIIH